MCIYQVVNFKAYNFLPACFEFSSHFLFLLDFSLGKNKKRLLVLFSTLFSIFFFLDVLRCALFVYAYLLDLPTHIRQTIPNAATVRHVRIFRQFSPRGTQRVTTSKMLFCAVCYWICCLLCYVC